MNECEGCDRTDCAQRGCIGPISTNYDVRNVMESAGLALYQDYSSIKQELEELQEKFRTACWLLREAEDTLARKFGANYPLGSIMHFLEENDK